MLLDRKEKLRPRSKSDELYFIRGHLKYFESKICKGLSGLPDCFQEGIRNGRTLEEKLYSVIEQLHKESLKENSKTELDIITNRKDCFTMIYGALKRLKKYSQDCAFACEMNSSLRGDRKHEASADLRMLACFFGDHTESVSTMNLTGPLMSPTERSLMMFTVEPFTEKGISGFNTGLENGAGRQSSSLTEEERASFVEHSQRCNFGDEVSTSETAILCISGVTSEAPSRFSKEVLEDQSRVPIMNTAPHRRSCKSCTIL